jgi:hypothetical protein
MHLCAVSKYSFWGGRKMRPGKSLCVFVTFVHLLLWVGSEDAGAAKLLASDGSANDRFGYSVGIYDNSVIVGAEYDGDKGQYSGSAYIFRYNDSNWGEEQKLLASDGKSFDLFGYSVGIWGNTAFIGARGGDSTGSVYVFQFNGSSWVEETKLFASDGEAGDWFGSSVAIRDDTAIVGAVYNYNGSNFGSAYIFRFNGSSWVQEAKLFATDITGGNNWFGNSVSIWGDTAVVGVQFDDDGGNNKGSAYVFRFNGSNWVEEQKLLASDGEAGDTFGSSVGISGDTIVIGANGDDDNDSQSGSAYIFRFNGSSWVEQAKLLASDGQSHDEFGSAVGISGDIGVIGAYRDDDNGSDSGSAYIFQFNGSNWVEKAKFRAFDGEAGERFGYSVAIGGDDIIIGVPRDDDNGGYSGSAYVYPDALVPSVIRGNKWHDINGDGEEDAGEQRMPGWRIYIDSNENGQFDADEPNDITDANGNYELTVLTGIWSVAEEHKNCCEQTCPGGDGKYSATVEPNEVAQGYNFGNAWSSEINPYYWQQNELDKEGAPMAGFDGTEDGLGASVSISGEYAIVGIPRFEDERTSIVDNGAAFIYKKYSATDCRHWTTVARLMATDPGYFDWFGSAVSINGGYAIVGSPYNNYSSIFPYGSAYVYYRGSAQAEHWYYRGKLLNIEGSSGDGFGYSVSIGKGGKYAIVGADGDDEKGADAGAAYIFEYDGTNWNQQVKLFASDGAAGDLFGSSVCISGDWAIVGAQGHDHFKGAAYMFFRPDVFGGTNYWRQWAKLTASDINSVGAFGNSVSLSGDKAIVGAYWSDGNGSSSGAAYVFKRVEFIIWAEEAKLLASDGAALDSFGKSVSISGDYAVVGAYFDNGGIGSAYIFEYDGQNWNQQAKLEASDGADDDRLGLSVSISGGFAIVGAPFDDDDGEDSGSAYIFGKVPCPGADLTNNCFVDFDDLGVLSSQWLFNELPLDLYPVEGDGIVNFADWAVFAQGWLTTYDTNDCAEFAEQWLLTGAKHCIADISPPPDGDCVVDMVDFAELAGQWLQGSEEPQPQ